ncbi:glycosyltransferase 87 family protein [Nocardia camponoti]|uniref:Membrane protein n=1 Tax=Nocardia camponoti TaxID=1616106 RepID=A0A917VBB1_9NOCA|nr:glycosyltransferase 87 family protein [Nocardia camponoti]GGK59198.1 membrane protein [Nocardia camponoti]
MNESPGVSEPVNVPVPARETTSGRSEAQQRQRQSRLLAAAVAFFVVSAAVALLAHWWHGYIDLRVYRNGARVWLDGGELYGPMPAVYGLALPFTYPPLAAAFFVPLALMPVSIAEVVVLATSLACLALCLFIVLGRVRPDLDRISVLTVIVAGLGFAQFLEPVRQTLNFGQINLVLMAAITADTLLRRTPWPRGMLIGIAVSIKLIPAGYLLYFVLKRDWKATITLIVSAIGAVTVGFLLFPRDSVEYWFHTVTDTGRIGTPYFAGNQSIKGTLFRLGLDTSTATYLWLGLSALTVALAAVWMARLLSAGRDVLALLVNAAAVLLISPVSWSHHWVWVALALVVAVDQCSRRRSRAFTALVAVVTAVFMVGPQWLFPHSGDRELQWNWFEQLVGSTYVWGTFAVIVYAVCTYHPAKTERPAADSVAAVG